jgi:hypothetical protein
MKKKKKDDTLLWLLLLDDNGQAFLVPDVAYAFALVDAAERLPIEGMEEEGYKDSPAAKMRRSLVAALRKQARQMAIFGNGVTLAQAENAALAASKAERDPLQKDAAANEAIVALTGNELHSRKVPPLDMDFEAEGLQEMIDASTAEMVENILTVTQLLNSGAFSAGRASTIVRTETAQAYMADKLSKMTGKKKVWRVSPGACPVCQALEGVTLPLGVKFQTKGYFGDVQHPPAHPNCRCSIEEA